ncbi:MAG: hypothetical protein IJ398_03795 [Clostridia bacterium]|nr:hypothetical protein [Clostridia bacterium]
MLTVLPIQSKDEQRELCQICGVEYNADAFAYKADDGDFIGVCQFTFKNDCGYIENLSYAPNMDDWEAMIIMLRATMSFMYRCGLKSSIIKEGATTDRLLKMSGYIKNENGDYFLDIYKFYNSSCSER